MEDEIEQFIIKNRAILRKMFEKEIQDIKEAVFSLPRGEQRDFQIEFVKQYEKYWLGYRLANPVEKPKKTDFV